MFVLVQKDYFQYAFLCFYKLSVYFNGEGNPEDCLAVAQDCMKFETVVVAQDCMKFEIVYCGCTGLYEV
jgi:hypothetical protein